MLIWMWYLVDVFVMVFKELFCIFWSFLLCYRFLRISRKGCSFYLFIVCVYFMIFLRVRVIYVDLRCLVVFVEYRINEWNLREWRGGFWWSGLVKVKRKLMVWIFFRFNLGNIRGKCNGSILLVWKILFFKLFLDFLRFSFIF